MESIFFDANPSLRQLTDNASKANDMLQRAQQKELKKVKTTKTAPVDSADLSTETEFMGDDMMGSMDPDDFGGGRSKHYFSADEEEFSEERRERLMEEKARREEEEKEESQRKLSSFIKTLKGEDAGRPAAARERAGAPPSSSGESGESPEEGGAETAMAAMSPSILDDESPPGHGEAPPVPYPDAPAMETMKAPPVFREGAAGAGSTGESAVPPEEGGIEKPPELKSREDVTLSREARKAPGKTTAPAGEAEKKPPPAEQQGWTSLLAWDEGFIIAEPQKKVEQAEEAAEAQMVYEALDLPEESAEALALGKIIEAMLVSPLEAPLFSLVKEALAPLGDRVLKVCRDFGTRIAVLGEGESILPYLPAMAENGQYGHLRAAYIPGEKLCIFGAEELRGKGEFFPPRLYFAHAFDHALGKDEFASLKSAAVQSSYRACMACEAGHLSADLFSLVSPVHYFAQAVESYLREGRPGGAFFTRDELYDYDRSMYHYVEYLFREINKEPSRPAGEQGGAAQEGAGS
ncbi:MAG: hypothetical protein RDV48_03705 [Candidatus Eremiobacteraeota bacterium]|nr:hypothetical protein [Candidatus Eremiobacteraeota bacterium]